jgi:hypothetical protein
MSTRSTPASAGHSPPLRGEEGLGDGFARGRGLGHASGECRVRMLGLDRVRTP